MAAAEPLQNIKAEVTCPICLELFWDPVTSECGHSFCRECIARLCQGDRDVACPQCNEELRKGNLRPNWELNNIVGFLSMQPVEEPRGGNVCKMHREPLRFYCKEDETPVCVACERSQAHRAHTVVPVEEAVQEHKDTIRQHLEGIESGYQKRHLLVSTGWTYLPHNAREEARQRLKTLIDNVATLLKVDTEGPRQSFADAASQTQPRDPDWRGVSPGREAAGETESQGPADADRDLETALLLLDEKGREPGSEPAAEKQEETGSHVSRVCEEAPSPKYGLDQATLVPEIHRISSTTEAAECKADAPSRGDSLQGLVSPYAARECGGIGQDGVSLAGNVTQPPDLQGCAVEVTLDPATAHPRLVLSGDHKGMSYTDRRRNLPDHPKRFDVSACALGSQGFTSGRHYWEVELVVGSHWAIGVTRDSANRKGNILLKPSFGFWTLSSSELPKSLPEGPRKVGVYLDYEGGEVRFYNAESKAQISSLTATFTGRVFPFFCLRSVGSYMKL